jgi:major vault protein
MADRSVIRIPPFHYVHVLDNNTNVTDIVVGPQTFTRPDHIRIVLGPEKMVSVPPRSYCIVGNPVVRDKDGAPVKETVNGVEQFKLKFGEEEVREAKEPFPLFPGETLNCGVTPLDVVEQGVALRLRARRDFTQEGSIKHVAGDEWLLEGPTTYRPIVEVELVERVIATIVKPNQALQLRARTACKDRKGVPRVAGEEWLVRDEGSYLPNVNEVIVRTLNAIVLTDKRALHLRANRDYTDAKVNRKAGEEWLVTLADTDVYIPDVYEEIRNDNVQIVTLTNRQWCTVLNPINPDTGLIQFGRKEVRTGEASFFLSPGESLEGGIQNVAVLGEQEALLLRANMNYTDKKGVEHRAGDLWMVYGPDDYIPPTQVDIIDRRRAIPLDKNEGIYVRDTKSGRVRAVIGETYQLKESEVLFSKELAPDVEALLASERDPMADRMTSGRTTGASKGARDKTRVVTYRVPHNAACQIYDYRLKRSKVVFGPENVMLGPDEQFTKINLSGGIPKKEKQTQSLVLLLGPDFMTDIVTVETSDHARLSLQLSYNWHFEVDQSNEVEAARLFNIPDFIGDACKAIASRVRGEVATKPFDEFHKNSARIIRAALFGVDEEAHVRDFFKFSANNLVITSIDIQSVEPVDQRTRDALQKSVQLAIEITTKSQEAAAKHKAAKDEQIARGALERQKIEDEGKAEMQRKELLQLQAESAAVSSAGSAKAEAQARAQALEIEGQSAVDQAALKSTAAKIESEAELLRLKAHQEAEVTHQRQLNALEIKKAQELAQIEIKKFKDTVDAIGSETIASIAQAGPEMQAKLLQGLGLKGFLVTDGNSPINLFNTANGLLGGGPAPASR